MSEANAWQSNLPPTGLHGLLPTGMQAVEQESEAVIQSPENQSLMIHAHP
jgi:hypothetical protein